MHGKTAQSIAREACAVIGRGVLVTDEAGIIIGCSDIRRVGTLHGPSVEVLRTGHPLLTSQADAERMAGVRPGYTAPIILSGQVVGTISIAGPPGEVERYGMLVQKQAEILLMEQSFTEMRLRRQQALRDLAESLLLFTPESGDDRLLLLSGRELGIDLRNLRIAVALALPEERAGDGMQRRAMDTASHFFDSPEHLIVSLRDRSIMLFLALPRPRERGALERSLRPLCEELLDLLRENGVEAQAGIGSEAETIEEIALSGRRAREALDAGMTLGGRVHSADALRIELLLSSIPRKVREAFAADVLGRLKDDELVRTFLAWCETPFAPAEVAKRLAVHRNTLQYRLKRIQDLSGLDPRNLHDCFALWSALTLRTLGQGRRGGWAGEGQRAGDTSRDAAAPEERLSGRPRRSDGEPRRRGRSPSERAPIR